VARAFHGPAADHRLPYDAELFGHWWFEGPWWLEMVLRRLAAHPERTIRHAGRRPDAPSDRAARDAGRLHVGLEGYNEVWLAGQND